MKCDNCEREIGTTTNASDYILQLRNFPCEVISNAVTDMLMYPPIEKDVYFCGIGCLRTWLDLNYHERE